MKVHLARRKAYTCLAKEARLVQDEQRPLIEYLNPEGPTDFSAEFSAEERAILDAINRRVAAAESLNAVMNFVFDSMRPICPCDRIGIAFLDENGLRVVSHWHKALYEPIYLGKGFAQDLRGSSLEGIIKTGRTRLINDLEQYLELHPDSVSTKLIVREGVRSNMTCPLIVEDRPVGFLFRSSREPYAYDDHQVRMHLAIAERLSQAVEKAYRIEQLDAANKAYFEMLGFISHELKSPLASMVMDADTLTMGYHGEMPEEQRQKVVKMADKARFLLGLVDDYLDLARIESGDLKTDFQTGLDFIEEVVEPAIEMTQSAMDKQAVTLTREAPERLIADFDPSLMRVALLNLMGNAVKYGEPNGQIRLRVEQADAKIRVSVWNSGPGFPRAEASRLFRKFSRLRTPELMKRKGTGVGLYTVWRVLQLHGGRVWAESEEGNWAEFHFEIPQPLPVGNDRQ